MIRNYIKIAFRNLKKHRQFSLINILGLSMALSVAVFMLLYVEDELSYDRAHPNANQLYRVSMQTQFAENEFHSAWTPPFIGARINADISEVNNYATLYKHFKGYFIRKNNEDIPINDIYYSSPNFFEFFGFKLKYGNPQNVLTDPGNIVLHERLAAKLFPGESIMGKSIETSDGTRIVTGLIEDSHDKSHFTPSVVTSFISHWNINDLSTAVNFDASFYNYIQLSRGSKLSSQKLNDLTKAYFEEWVNADVSRKNDFGNQKFELKMQRVTDIHLSSNLEFEMEANGDRSTVIIYSFVAIMILIIASINYSNLASARNLDRMKELGIRKVMGSGRWQIAIQFFTESLVINLASAVIAFIIVLLAMPFFNTISGKSMDLHQLIQLKPTVGLAIILMGCSTLSSFYPSIFIYNIKPISIFQMKNFGVGKGSRFRKAMLVLQIAVSGILLIFTFVVFQQFKFMQNHELGFQEDQIMVVEVKSRAARSKIPALKDELLKLSGIKAIALTGQVPGSENLKTEPMGFESKEGEISEILTNYMFSEPDLINVLKLKINRGSNFDVSKGGANRGQEVIVNQSLVRAMNWDNPIGKKVKLPIGDASVVGVVDDFHLKSLHHKIQPLTIIYLDNWAEALLVKVDSEKITEKIKNIQTKYESIIGGATFNYSFLDEGYALHYKSDQQRAKLFMIFSALTICIACMGLVGLIGFTLVRRSKEIGIRRVFGANSGKILALFIKEYAYMILIGLLIAIPVANYLIKDWLMNFPYKMTLSFIYYIVPVSTLLILSVLVIAFRTYKAASANPANILRNE